jgi:hypothetical protein
VAFQLFLVGAVPLFVFICWGLWAYSTAIRRSGHSPFGPESTSFYFSRQPDRQMERRRLRVWIAFGFWIVYVLVGYDFWTALLGRK